MPTTAIAKERNMAKRPQESEHNLAPGTLAVLAATPAVFDALFAEQRQGALDRLGDEGWSPNDVLAHLASIQRVALVGRVKAMLESDLPTLPDVDEHENLAAMGLRGRPAAELLHIFRDERAQAMLLFNSLRPDDLQRRGRHSLAGEITVADALHHMAYHDLLHIAQAANLLAEPISGRRGAMGEAFPV
jgi:hypothetical protein